MKLTIIQHHEVLIPSIDDSEQHFMPQVTESRRRRGIGRESVAFRDTNLIATTGAAVNAGVDGLSTCANSDPAPRDGVIPPPPPRLIIMDAR